MHLYKEACLVPTFRRSHYLYCCLKRIRAQDEKIPIIVFSDRGEDNEELRHVCEQFLAGLEITPRHDYYGNSFSVMEMLRWAYGQRIGLVHIVENDFMMAPDCLAWHRKMHEMFGESIFAACGWIFNRQAPISDDIMFAPWYYAPNASLKREKLAEVVKHANPLYYNGMRQYVLSTFPDSLLHAKGAYEGTNFYEQDSLFQYCIEQSRGQVAWNGIAKGAHVGAGEGYNCPKGPVFEGTLDERIAQVEELIADPWWRAELFTRPVVEREIGRHLEKREFKYRVTLPGGWQSELKSELKLSRLPRRMNSVNLPIDAQISLI